MKINKRKAVKFGVLLFCAASVIFTITLIDDRFAIFKQKSDIEIEIEPGNSTVRIAEKLKEKGAIIYPKFFSFYCRFLSKEYRRLRYGKFMLNGKELSYDGILNVLSKESNNEDEEAQLVIFEGSNMFNINRNFEKYCSFTLDDVIKELNSKENYSKYRFTSSIKDETEKLPFPLEGFFYPANYRVNKHYSAKQVARLILEKTNHFIERIGNLKNGISGKMCMLTLWEIYVIASIIQAETGNEDEMKKVSSVIHNRLKYGRKNPEIGYKCRLECDTTNKYAEKLKKYMEKYSNEVDENLIEGYDTFSREGLPIGPICNPGEKAIEAAINPAKTEYFFFCTDIDDNKKVYYAKNLADHKVNLVKAGINN